jgi:hypothetical protein
VAGAAVAALTAAVLLRSPGALPASRTSAPASGGTAARSAAEEAGALQLEIAGLEQRLQFQKAEHERLRAATPATPSRVAAARRGALAKRVAARAAAIANDDFLRSSEGLGLQTDLQRWLAALCEETGLTLAEATWSPDGLYAFIAEVIASLDPPLPEQARQDFDAARERVGKEWDAYMKEREGMTLLRRGLETTEFVNLLYGAIGEAVPDDRADEVYASFDEFELSWGDTGASNHRGTRPEIRTKLVEDWASQFELRPEQKPALGPIVDEFMTRYEALEARAPTGPGTTYEAGRESRRAAIALQEEMQRRIGAELDLSAEQAERLKQWSRTYGFEVTK